MTSLLPATPPPEAVTGPDLPLSFPQEQLWFMEGLAPGTYNELWLLRIDGDLDPARLGRALSVVVDRQAVLRSTFPEVDGRPVCRLLPRLELPLDRPTDLSYLPEQQQERITAQLAAEIADQPYQIASGPLMRAALLRLRPDQHALVLATHHIVADGWSLRVVLADLLTAYQDLSAGRPPSLPPLPCQYPDYAARQRARHRAGEQAADLAWWHRQLAGAPAAWELLGRWLRPPVKSSRGERVRIDLDPALAAPVAALARTHHTTPAAVLLAAFAAVAHRYTGRDDLPIGTASAGRPAEELEPLVGFFANPLVLRLRVDPQTRFADLVQHVTEVSLDALDHQGLPFASLVEALAPERDLSYHPLVQVAFSYAEVGDTDVTRAGLRVRYEHVPRNRSRFDLIVEAQAAPDALRFWVEFDSSLFTGAEVARLFDHYGSLLAAVVQDPSLPVVDAPMLSPAERARGVAEVPPVGLPPPTRPVVLVGDALAPTGVTGTIHYVDPQRVAIHGDRLRPVGDQAAIPPGTEFGYWSEAGELVHLGPAQRLPAVNGLRVPLDEVASTLAVHPAVRSATVTCDPDRGLVAEVTPAGPDHPAGTALHRHLAAVLPRYAIPTRIAIGGQPADSAPATGMDPLLEQVRQVWEHVLERTGIDPDEDFFALGGHSMLAASIVLQLRRDLAVALPLRRIFEHPTIRTLAAAIAVEQAGPPPAVPAPASRPAQPLPATSATGSGPDSAPLTGAQSQLWVLDHLAPQLPTYHSPMEIRIDGSLDAAALQAAFDHVVARHEVLRTVIRFEGGQPVQVPLPTGPGLATMELAALPAGQREAELARLSQEQATRPFRLEQQPGLRALLVRLAEQRHVLMLTIHHILMDGVGYEVFCRELSACYRALVAGDAAELPPLPYSWLEYARWERDWLAGPEAERLTRYWLRHLAGLPTLRLPTPSPRPESLTFDGEQQVRLLAADLSEAVLALARRHGVTAFMAVTAAFAALLHHQAGQDEVVLAAASENRRRPGSRQLVGCTMSTLVLRLDASGDPPFDTLLGRVGRTVLDAYDHQGLPLPRLVQAAGTKHEPSRLPLFQVAVEWQEPEASGWDLPGCATSWRFRSTGTARTDLYLTAATRAGRLELSLEHNTRLWSPADAEAMLDALGEVLAAAAADPTTPLSRLPGHIRYRRPARA